MPEAQYKSLPFDEAINFFRGKVDIPTEKWTDMWQGMHSRAFVVAGAMKSELLSDMRTAIDKAISEGTTLKDFRAAFDKTVKKHGWNYKGERGWRTATIFDTNLRTAYSAGHYKQMTSPAVLEARPYWRYIGGFSFEPRPEHLGWSGTVLTANDPWWDTHFAPNGWGCKCKVVSHSTSELERKGLKVGKAPEGDTYEWTNKTTGEVLKVPQGIDPGWAYNPGKAAFGSQLSETAMSEWKAKGAKAWERLTPGNYRTQSRPQRIPVDPAKALMGKKISKTDLKDEIEQIIGAEEKIYSFKAKDFRYDVLVNANTLARHIDIAKTQYLPFLAETLTDPYEVWLSFEKHKGTGKVVLRQRIIKAITTGKKEGMMVVTNAVNGVMEAWTMVPVSRLTYLNRQREGKLIYAR